MFSKFSRWYFLPFFLSAVLAYPGVSQAQSLKRKASFDQNWKFYQGDPGTGAAATTYNDASWQVVCIPHSASYDSTTVAAESNFYQGTCWYRKSFVCPATAQKVFIEFEGAMQTATLWINGDSIGQHINSGYTPFCYDIGSHLKPGTANEVALRLNNVKSPDIPPGGASPDYNLYGGLSRDVWLRFKDSVYIPVNTQQILTSNASAASTQIRAKTQVVNSSTSAQNATVVITLLDATHTIVTSDSASQNLPANGNYTYDITARNAVTNPHLWSPSSPYMYSVQTLVKVNGAVVDSVVEPCGVRWFSWSVSNGFSLNGSRFEIRGMCVHQFEGWVGNATSDERYYQEIKVLKAMGCNSIRCSHYPRAQAFYNAADQMGILLYVEQPSWGWGVNPTATCWARMDSCVKEMVMSARNHPSIYAWGLYNEPVPLGGASGTPTDFTPYMTILNNMAHSLDSTRVTSTANINSPYDPSITVPDIVGLNYAQNTGGYSSNGINTDNMPWVGTESRITSTFTALSARGSLLDLDTTNNVDNSGNAASEWNYFNFTLATSGQLAGGHFWCFKDYSSPDNTVGFEGVTDRFTVPKVIYWMFRQEWTGLAPDYPRPGTATTIDLEADTNALYASGSDYFLITAALRDANGHQISSDSGEVAFTISDPAKAGFFGGNFIKAYGGRAGGFLRTTTSSGTFTVMASYPGITVQPTITLTTLPLPVETYYNTGTSVLRQQARPIEAYKLTVMAGARGFSFRCPPAAGILRIVDCQGRSVYVSGVQKNASLFINRHALGSRLFYAVWEGGDQKLVSRINTTD
jgi:beta-galactosidase